MNWIRPDSAAMADGDDHDPDTLTDEQLQVLIARRRAEYEAPPHRALLATAPSFFIPPPFGWRHPVTGKLGWQPGLELIAFGMYVKRARYLAGVTQQRLEELSGVDQGQISRLERALAPSTRTQELVKIGKALGRSLPLGFCPHEHWCEWQRAPDPPKEKDWLAEARGLDERLGRGVDETG
ncbi:MAG: helix-turn-helix domain-containing protein [Chloroflexota bacterium]